MTLKTWLKQNQQQLSSKDTSSKQSCQKTDNKKNINTNQSSKKCCAEEMTVSTQLKSQVEDKQKKSIICYQCQKKNHYKSQCSELTSEQGKNVNWVSVKEVQIKKKDQHSLKTLQT